MNISNWFVCALLIGFLGTAAFARENAQPVGDTALRVTVRMRMLPNGLAEVPVSVNGRGPFYFVLDTATETSLIDADLARQLKLETVDRLNLQTPNGPKTLIRTFADELSLGVFSEAKLELLEERLNETVVKSDPLFGILGQNFLARFDLLIDYKQRELTLWRAGTGTPPPGKKIMLGSHNHCPTVTVQTGRDRPLRLYLDSGTTAITLFRNSQDFRLCTLLGCGGTLTNTVGSRQLLEGRFTNMLIGDARLHDVPAFLSSANHLPATSQDSGGVAMFHAPTTAASDAGRPTAEKEEDTLDGMFPTALFSKIYISARDSYAVITP